MRDTKFRTRLFLCFLAVIVMTLVLPGLYVRKNIKEDGIEETVRNARREAVLIRMQMETAPDGVHGLSSTFDRIGTELGIRITFIGADGTVLAESDSSRVNLNDLDNHADRQEIGAAIREGFGVSIRHSNTLDTDLVYAAIPFAAVGKLPDGFIRVAVPLKHVEERIAQSERQWLAIVGLATLIALLFAYGLSTHLERSLKEMIRVVESIATDPAGQGNRRRLHILPGREFRRLAHAVNDMADRTEEHLRTIAENKAQLKTILDVMNEGVLVIGEKGRIRLVNPALVRLFPQAKDAEGKFPVEVIPAAEIQQALDELLSAPQDKPRLITLEVEPRPDMILSVQFIRPREAIHDVLAVAVFHDISEMARLMRVRKEFVANVSHELRTPLTAIAGYAETLRDSAAEDPSICAKFAETILRNAQHMGTMVEDLLKLSRIESGAVPMEMETVKAASILSDVTTACQPQTAAHNLTLETDIDPALTVRADPHFIGQVFRNLIENACRYAPEGSTIKVSGGKRLDLNGLPEALFMIWHSAGGHRPRVRAFLQGGEAPQQPRLHRARPCHLQAHRRAPRRANLGGTRPRRLSAIHASPRCGNGKKDVRATSSRRGPYRNPQCPPDGPAQKNSRKDAPQAFRPQMGLGSF